MDGFIDAQTAFGGDSIWVERDGSWHRQATGIPIAVTAALRLDEAFLLAGPQSASPHGAEPLAVVASRNGKQWTPVDDLADRPEATIRGLTTVISGVIAVGDAVYLGPDTISDYD